MHAMSGATIKKEWMLSRSACSACEFEQFVHPKNAKWLEQVHSIGGDKTEASHNFLNTVLWNDQRAITQDGRCICYHCVKIIGCIF